MKTSRFVILLGLLASPLASAQPAQPAQPGQPAPGLAEYQAAIERELSGVVFDGAIGVDLAPDGSATVTYHQPDGRSVGRTVNLPPRREDAIELVALLAANLVRDQAPELPAAAPAPPAPAPPVASVASGAPAVTPGSLAATQLQAQAVVRTVPVSVGLLWPLTTDRLYDGAVAPRLGLHVIAGSGVGVRGVSVAGAADLQRGEVSGAQVAGAVAWAPALRGVQVAGAVTAATAARGVQVAGALTRAQTLRGVQIAGAATVAGQVRGLQIAGGVAVAQELRGVQVSPINLAGHVRGIQVGVINYASSSEGASIGLLNIVRDGFLEIDAGVDSAGTAEVDLRHGTPRFYSVYGAGTSRDRELAQLGMGFGTRLRQDGRLTIEADAMALTIIGDALATDVAVLARPRLGATYSLGAVALWAAASANVLVAGDGERGDALHPSFDRSWSSGDVTTRLWPSVSFGVRVRAL